MKINLDLQEEPKSVPVPFTTHAYKTSTALNKAAQNEGNMSSSSPKHLSSHEA